MTSKILARVRQIESDALNTAADGAAMLRRYAAALENARSLQRAHSGSWFGDHAFTYFGDFKEPPAGASFDVEWGFGGFETRQHRGWKIRSLEEINRRLYPTGQSFEQLQCDAENCEAELRKVGARLSDILQANATKSLGLSESVLAQLRTAVAEALKTRGGGISFPNMTRDSANFAKGGRYPVHSAAEHQISLIKTVERAGVELAEACRRIVELAELEEPIAPQRDADAIFLGHGRSLEWLKLARHLENSHRLSTTEFNQESPAGVTTKERLEEMLGNSTLAFLIMTGDDFDALGNAHARENVIHEVGLLQGRIGWRKAIILMEDGCSEFSNIHGLNHIKFPKGKIEAAFGDVDRVLRREALLK
jgi:hypothetical protein